MDIGDDSLPYPVRDGVISCNPPLLNSIVLSIGVAEVKGLEEGCFGGERDGIILCVCVCARTGINDRAIRRRVHTTSSLFTAAGRCCRYFSRTSHESGVVVGSFTSFSPYGDCDSNL